MIDRAQKCPFPKSAPCPLSILVKTLEFNHRNTFYSIFTFRLRDIEMSEYDASVYEKFSGNVQGQVKSIRIMLDSLQVSEVYTHHAR